MKAEVRLRLVEERKEAETFRAGVSNFFGTRKGAPVRV